MRTYKSKSEDKTLRKDAIDNKKGLIEAAIKLFENSGVDVPMAEIAKVAGVSRMTFYRNFPDKKSLVAAVFDFNLTELEKYSHDVNNEEDVFFRLLEKVMEQRAKYNLFHHYLDEEQGRATVERLVKIFKNPVKKAQEKGLLRQDFSVQKDLILLIMMMGGALVNAPFVENDKLQKRAFQFILEGVQNRRKG